MQNTCPRLPEAPPTCCHASVKPRPSTARGAAARACYELSWLTLTCNPPSCKLPCKPKTPGCKLQGAGRRAMAPGVQATSNRDPVKLALPCSLPAVQLARNCAAILTNPLTRCILLHSHVGVPKQHHTCPRRHLTQQRINLCEKRSSQVLGSGGIARLWVALSGPSPRQLMECFNPHWDGPCLALKCAQQPRHCCQAVPCSAAPAAAGSRLPRQMAPGGTLHTVKIVL